MAYHILITAGGTREYIDPVRFISNDSSGQMGYALAQAALAAGHEVTLITAPCHLPAPAQAHVVSVTSAQDMFEAVQNHYDLCDCVVMAAAVSDYTLDTQSNTKLKKSEHPLTLTLIPTRDILQWTGEHKTHGSRPKIIVGFALEDHDVLARAEAKLARKHLDMVIANTPEAIGSTSSTLFVKIPEKAWVELPRADKATNAHLIIKHIESLHSSDGNQFQIGQFTIR
ncbi:MAG: phosphopantothenoylcysteine decarboxylase [Phycisphaeraceae bacterium]|nr:phosphopantothenoylcysteine decarboxylase [Phycisphaeraceae bacterium]